MNNNNEQGILIVLEGLSSAGKSVAIEKILKGLDDKENVVLVEWNSNPKVRWILRRLIRRNYITPMLYCLLQWKSFIIDYFFTIRPNLRRGNIVIADRYIYTAFTRDTLNGINQKFIRLLYGFAQKPNIILFLNTPPEVCIDRARKHRKSIFYLCKHIYKSKLIDDKELHYLRELYCNYTKIFSEMNVQQDVRVINANDFPFENIRIQRQQLLKVLLNQVEY